MIGDLVTGRSADNTGSGGGGVSVPLQEMDDPGKVQTTHTRGGETTPTQGEWSALCTKSLCIYI